MSSLSEPTVLQFGFSTAGGVISNLGDQDEATFWQPYADGLDGYTVPPVADNGNVLPGAPRPAIQFDFGESVRIPFFRVVVEKTASMGSAYLIASNATATSVDDTVQAGDVWAGGPYTVAQMNSGESIDTFAKTTAIRGRYWRFVFIQQPPPA